VDGVTFTITKRPESPNVAGVVRISRYKNFIVAESGLDSAQAEVEGLFPCQQRFAPTFMRPAAASGWRLMITGIADFLHRRAARL